MRLLQSLVEDILRPLSGPLGIWLRRQYYRRRLQHCGNGLHISEGVYIQNPSCVALGDNVWLDKRVILIAGKPSNNPNIRRKSIAEDAKTGFIRIGSHSHLGVDTLVQGHSGVWIDDFFTSSRGVSIYSYSNDPYRCLHGTLPSPDTYYIATPVSIGRNTWIGINSVLVGACLGDNTFVKPYSLVTGTYSDNVVIEGQPALFLKKRFS